MYRRAEFTLAVYVHLLDEDLPDPSFFDAASPKGGNEGATQPTETDLEDVPEQEPISAENLAAVRAV
jgi:hypothetical protein